MTKAQIRRRRDPNRFDRRMGFVLICLGIVTAWALLLLPIALRLV